LKNVAVVGAGLSGATLAHQLYLQGYNLTVMEQEARIGGLLQTIHLDDNEFLLPFGPHIFHTKQLWVYRYLSQFTEFNDYTHRKGVYIGGELYSFPLSRTTIESWPIGDVVLSELDECLRWGPQLTFEEEGVRLFGNTLYHTLIKPYSEKMWGPYMEDLNPKAVLHRIDLRQHDSSLFLNQHQGTPKAGYEHMLDEMLSNISVQLKTPVDRDCNFHQWEIVFFTGSITDLLPQDIQALPFRSLLFPMSEGVWERSTMGTINLPQHPTAIRKAKQAITFQQRNEVIQWQIPTEPIPGIAPPMYPVPTADSSRVYYEHLRWLVQTYPNVIPAGRLGLYLYLDMDKAVMATRDLLQVANKWLSLSIEQKMEAIRTVREKYNG
jgi:UDP-galactopyranose mutase